MKEPQNKGMQDTRQTRILELLYEHGTMTVKDLAVALHTSEVTLRKDVTALAKKGMLARQHGSVRLANLNNVQARMAIHYAEKRSLAMRASKLVEPESTIMVENGSCCALLVEALATRHVPATIVTNSAFIAQMAARESGLESILLGGTFQGDSEVCVGPLLRDMAERFSVPQCFLGVDGFSGKDGFSNKDLARAEAARTMAARAKKCIVLTEAQKFSEPSVVPLRITVDTVVTDENLPQTIKMKLNKQGIEVL